VSSGAVTPVVTGTGLSNYNITSTNGAYSITQAPVTATAGSYSSTYDGAAHSPSACAVTGTYKGDLACTNDPASVGPDVSSGAVTPVVTGTGLTNYDITLVNGSFTIIKADQTITVTTAAPANAVNTSVFTVAATASSGLPVAITTTGSCTGSGTGSATITMNSGAGTCVVHYNQAGNGNYNPAPEKTSNTNAKVASAVCAWIQPVLTPVQTFKIGSTLPLKVACDSGVWTGGLTVKATVKTGATTVLNAVAMQANTNLFIYGWNTPKTTTAGDYTATAAFSDGSSTPAVGFKMGK
jgi:hypothetical protein